MSTTAEIHELGTRWVAAEIAGDTDTLATMITDDFRLVGPYGFVLDRDQWLNRYRTGDFVTQTMTWHDVDIRQYGDTVVTIGTQTQEAAYQGNQNDGDFRISHVFVRRDDRWVMASAQLSLTTLPGPPAS